MLKLVQITSTLLLGKSLKQNLKSFELELFFALFSSSQSIWISQISFPNIYIICWRRYILYPMVQRRVSTRAIVLFRTSNSLKQPSEAF
jgi:hypothetical protein